jgi:NADPH:quinone reductase-like Zn-dependent oxidoreductase
VNREGHHKVLFERPDEGQAELEQLREFIASGQIHSVIDSHYPLEEMVAAHEYVDSGVKQGHVVIDVVGP